MLSVSTSAYTHWYADILDSYVIVLVTCLLLSSEFLCQEIITEIAHKSKHSCLWSIYSSLHLRIVHKFHLLPDPVIEVIDLFDPLSEHTIAWFVFCRRYWLSHHECCCSKFSQIDGYIYWAFHETRILAKNLISSWK